MKYDYQITRRDSAYQGFFRLDRVHIRHERYAGGYQEVVRECFERGNAAAVIPYDPALDEIVLIEQFRVGGVDNPAGPWMIEVVAGILGADETPEAVVRRETVEESGCVLGVVEPVCEFVLSPGGCSERIFLFCGQVDASEVSGIHGLRSEGEDIRVMSVGFDEAMEWLNQGKLSSAISIIALQWLALNRDDLRERWALTPSQS